MKLIIEIDEKDYKDALIGCLNVTAFHKAVRETGRPLSDYLKGIKSEINAEIKVLDVCFAKGMVNGMKRANKIITKYIKECDTDE